MSIEATKHDHYFHDVKALEKVDIYRVLELFGVSSHPIGHAIKKLLAAGQRGRKNSWQDVQEAIDSLRRWQEMREEDAQIARDSLFEQTFGVPQPARKESSPAVAAHKNTAAESASPFPKIDDFALRGYDESDMRAGGTD